MKSNELIIYFKELKDLMIKEKNHLIELDHVVGDGDLGLTMSDGYSASYEEMINNTQRDCGLLLYYAGKAMANAVPSTMGTLMASGWMEAGKTLKGKMELQDEDIIMMFMAFETGVMKRGKANVGEKTFLDGIHPAIDEFKTYVGKLTMIEISEKAYEASIRGYKDTKGMLAVHGRAATRGEASRDLQDPGAYVATLMMLAFKQSLQK